MKIPFNRERILHDAEAGARQAHVSLRHRDHKWLPLTGKDENMLLEERVSRAREYAVWRVSAYERGEVGQPW